MIRSNVGPPRGILHRNSGEKNFDLVRTAPGTALSPFVEHFWIVTWDLRGKPPYVAETLPHPSVHFVAEDRRAEIVGVHTGRFTRRLSGQGRVFGIKFRPACFYPFFRRSLHVLTDRRLPVRTVFGATGVELALQLRGAIDERQCVVLAEGFLHDHAWEPELQVEQIRDLVERMATDREVIRVDQLVALAGIDLRRLQRLFRTYVGVGPKWLIQRYRLHEAAEQIASGSTKSMAELAYELGYFDQAHFIRDFKAIVGATPGEYAAEAVPRT